MLTHTASTLPHPAHARTLGIFDERARRRIRAVAIGTLRYGVVALLLLWGAFKFTAFEAEAIRPLVEHSPLMAWLYPLLGVRGTSALIGVVELAAALLMCVHRWKPNWSAVGSLIASATFVVTLSFLFTTPDVLSPDNPWGGFLMKDLLLLGAALFSAAESLDAAARTRE